MKRFHLTIPLIASAVLVFCGSRGLSQTSLESVEPFLPHAAVTDAWYIQIEPDPGFDVYVRRMREAREKNPEWFVEYVKKHQTPDNVPVPHHENFGMSKKEYEHFIHPMNHFREIKRKQIKIVRSGQPGHVQLEFQGEDLLLSKVAVNVEDSTVKTPFGILPKREFVETQTASLPPGRHRGVAFSTPDARIVAEKRRESLLIGELKDTKSGIIHYAINTPGQVRRIYIQFQK